MGAIELSAPANVSRLIQAAREIGCDYTECRSTGRREGFLSYPGNVYAGMVIFEKTDDRYVVSLSEMPKNTRIQTTDLLPGQEEKFFSKLSE